LLTFREIAVGASYQAIKLESYPWAPSKTRRCASDIGIKWAIC